MTTWIGSGFLFSLFLTKQNYAICKHKTPTKEIHSNPILIANPPMYFKLSLNFLLYLITFSTFILFIQWKQLSSTLSAFNTLFVLYLLFVTHSSQLPEYVWLNLNLQFLTSNHCLLRLLLFGLIDVRN